MPKLAQVNDKFTMMRSVSYTPKGLFNHTAAIYQMMTGYTTDKVSPFRSIGTTQSQGFSELRIQLDQIQASHRTHVALRHASQTSSGKRSGWERGAAGFLGKAYDPYTLYPPGSDMDMNKMAKIRWTTWKCVLICSGSG